MGLYCTHKMVASLKQDRRSLGARQGETILLKRQRWSERNGISRTCHVKRSLDSLRSWSGCFVHEAGCRMRLSVRRWPRVRFCVRRRRVCPGEKKRTLRKSAFCSPHLTKKRILQPAAHGKAHSAAARSAIVYTNDPKRRREVIFANLCTLLRPHVCPGEEKRIVAPTAAFVRHVKAHFVCVPMVRVRLSVRHTAGRHMPIPVPSVAPASNPARRGATEGTIMARRQRRPKARRARRP